MKRYYFYSIDPEGRSTLPEYHIMAETPEKALEAVKNIVNSNLILWLEASVNHLPCIRCSQYYMKQSKTNEVTIVYPEDNCRSE